MPRLMPPVLLTEQWFSVDLPMLSGDGLVLRPWEDDDAPAVLAAYSDPDIQRWHTRAMTSETDASAWISEARAGWMLELRAEWAVESDGAVVARVNLRNVDPIDGVAEVGYWVLPTARGHNIAARAVDIMRRWAFGDFGLHRLELEHSAANEASCRVAERAGFAAEGVRRSRVLHTDGWHDTHLHGCVAR